MLSSPLCIARVCGGEAHTQCKIKSIVINKAAAYKLLYSYVRSVVCKMYESGRE